MATTIAALHGHTWQHYYGAAVLIGGTDPTGTTTPLTPTTAARLRDLAGSFAEHTTTSSAADGGTLVLLTVTSASPVAETRTGTAPETSTPEHAPTPPGTHV